MKHLFSTILLITAVFQSVAGQDLSDYIDKNQSQDTIREIESTFRSARVVNLHSVEVPTTGELVFNVGHRFGEINKGVYEMFGLDQATIRLGFDYGINDRLGVGIGRSSYQKSYDAWIKTILLKQNNSNMPVSLAGYLTASQNTLKNIFPGDKDSFSGRLSYGGSLILARKFSEFFSLQIMPVWLKSNYLPKIQHEAENLSLGTGARIKLSPMLHTNIEFIKILNEQNTNNKDVFSIGFDLETGGHVFQLFLSNTRGITETPLLMNTSGTWDNGEIFFGFNITRTFYLSQ